MKPKYILQVQLTPKVHEGRMQYYWHIDLHTEDGQFTVKHGWAHSFNFAMILAETEAKKLV